VLWTLLFPVLTARVRLRRDLNLEGRHIDLCMNSGKDCGQKAAQAVCEYLGFDGAVTDQWSSAVADAPARSMTGAAAFPRRLGVRASSCVCERVVGASSV